MGRSIIGPYLVDTISNNIVSPLKLCGVRTVSLIDPAPEIKFARAVDVLRYLNIPGIYPGLIHNKTYHESMFRKLVDEPLGSIALGLHSAVDPRTSTLSHDTRSVVTSLERSPDKSIVSIGRALDLTKDFMLSSWTKVNCYELDFNIELRKPDAVIGSLAFSMPKTLDGEIALAICLRDEDMERLRADEEFLKYGKYIR